MNLSQSNNVLVIGDILLDKYSMGKVSRISPEAPIPVVKIESVRFTLGGAMNVCNNLSALGAPCSILGVVGNDQNGNIISSAAQSHNIDISGLVISHKCSTHVKERIIGNRQQIVRLDYYDDVRPDECDLALLKDNFSHRVSKFDVIIISDYAKGVCTPELCREVIECSRENRKAVIVDPKGTDWSKYRGAAMITPNLKELSEFMGEELENDDKVIEHSCKNICADLGVNYLLITRSEKGMTFVTPENQYIHVPSEAKEVYDVSGAGDTVVAVMGAYFGTSHCVNEELRLANIAAGIAVSKFGTAAVSAEEIKSAVFANRYDAVKNKIVSLEKLLRQVDNWKKSGESIIFTNGCYDILHSGHVQSIYAAAAYGDHLIVAVNSDRSVKRNKGASRPINQEDDRAMVIAALGCVDAVLIFDEDTPEYVLNKIRPDVLVKGADYKVEDVVGREYAGRVELVDYLEGYSTTNTMIKMTGGSIL